jgi:hypothetical protein
MSNRRNLIARHGSAPFGSSTPAAAVALAGALLLAGAAWASSHSINISTHDDDPILSCDQIVPRFGDHAQPLPMARDQRQFSLSRSATPVLEMHLAAEGGMALTGWGGNDYEVTACLAAAGGSDARASEVLRQVEVGFEAGRLSVHGPGDADWMVYLIVRVPKDAVLDLKSGHAPIDLRDVRGTIKARVENGPIALDRCRGEIDVEAENGPLSVRSGGGRERLKVANGPLDIELDGGRWDGEGIEAHAENGPLSLKIPKGYGSGVSVALSSSSPLECQAGCDDASEAAPGGTRHLHFGPARPVIRVSAVNGPVAIDSGSPARNEGSI